VGNFHKEKNMYGWHGRVLRVDLSTGKITPEEVPQEMIKSYIGGRGWAIRYLYDEVDPKVDPFAAENKLIFATGPLTATTAPTGNRYMVVTKSPLTGALAHSNSGGDFPTWMKRTGYDMYIFEGRAAEPVYLYVTEEKAEIRPASHLWGKTVPDTTDLLIEETSKAAKVACIGPAGENRVLMAAVMNDKHRAAARSGVGAVMGSKNLKAVVAEGRKYPAFFDDKGMRKFSVELSKQVGADMKAGSSLREYGTAYVPQVTNTLGILPAHNFQEGTFEHVDKVDGVALKEKYLIKHVPCWRCPISCGRLTAVDDEKYAGKGEGPEYETISSLGTACGLDNLAALTKANYWCNELGLDTISTGLTIAAAMELYEDGVIDDEITGQPLRFGDGDAVIAMVQKMAYREGFGDQLAEGSYRLAEKYDRPEVSVTARKQELPGYDPRGAQGMGLLYATSNKGASHMEGDVAYPEVFGVPHKIDPLTSEGKAELVAHFQDAFALIDSAGLCVFFAVRYVFSEDVKIWPVRFSRLLNLATGAEYTPEEVMQAAERVYTLERLFLIEAGTGPEDDTLSPRLLHQPLPDGPAKGKVVELDAMLGEYYTYRNWPGGYPAKGKLVELGLA
jgi:aldehyde:ferredoxin oxidoreductase